LLILGRDAFSIARFFETNMLKRPPKSRYVKLEISIKKQPSIDISDLFMNDNGAVTKKSEIIIEIWDAHAPESLLYFIMAHAFGNT